MNLFKAYKYLFYRTFVWQREMFGDENVPGFVAISANSLCIFVNLITLVICLEIVTGYRLRIEKIYSCIGIVLLLLINYFILLHKNKFGVIIEEFDSENKIQRKTGTILCWVYVIVTYSIFLASVLVLSPGTGR